MSLPFLEIHSKNYKGKRTLLLEMLDEMDMSIRLDKITRRPLVLNCSPEEEEEEEGRSKRSKTKKEEEKKKKKKKN